MRWWIWLIIGLAVFVIVLLVINYFTPVEEEEYGEPKSAVKTLIQGARKALGGGDGCGAQGDDEGLF